MIGGETMADISWIKLKTTMFDDEKIRLIQAIPDSNAILVIWIRLLVLAGKTNDDGLIYIQRNMPYSDEMLATLFSENLNTIRLALTTLSNFNMIDINDDGLIAISNWEKHQNVDGMDQIRLKNAERNRRYRERKKQLELDDSVISHVTSRDGTDIDIDIEVDTDKELDKEIDKEYKNIGEQDFNFPAYLSQESIDAVKKGKKENYNKRIPIAYLNQVTGKSYKFIESNTKLVDARFNEGYSVDDFKTVIDKKVAEWQGTDMSKFIRPQTLFGTKFDGYLNQEVKNSRLKYTGSKDYENLGW